jgi:hypothetical protein
VFSEYRKCYFRDPNFKNFLGATSFPGLQCEDEGRDEEAPVNSMSFIWNDNMREKREANTNAT